MKWAKILTQLADRVSPPSPKRCRTPATLLRPPVRWPALCSGRPPCPGDSLRGPPVNSRTFVLGNMDVLSLATPPLLFALLYFAAKGGSNDGGPRSCPHVQRQVCAPEPAPSRPLIHPRGKLGKMVFSVRSRRCAAAPSFARGGAPTPYLSPGILDGGGWRGFSAPWFQCPMGRCFSAPCRGGGRRARPRPNSSPDMRARPRPPVV